jgi:metal-responsive CopG/Arc/MetJ family transcriptional regulator
MIVLPDPQVEAAMGEVSMRVTSFRLPVAMLDELARYAGRDRDGRSGLVRVAIERLLAEMREAA